MDADIKAAFLMVALMVVLIAASVLIPTGCMCAGKYISKNINASIEIAKIEKLRADYVKTTRVNNEDVLGQVTAANMLISQRQAELKVFGETFVSRKWASVEHITIIPEYR